MGHPKGFMNTGREEALDRDPRLRVQDFEEIPVNLTEGKLQNQSSRCMDCGVPFCMSGCPLGNLIPDFNDLVYRGQWEEAVRTLYATNNFPEVTGRICPAPCESSCVLGITDPPVTIKQMEKAIAEKAEEYDLMRPHIPEFRSGYKVAVVGSGPAGLACAQQLNYAGHQVTIYEKAPAPGGLLTWGIPAYKLPKDVVARRVDLIEQEGVAFICNTNVGRDISWAKLRDEFDALVICIGAEVPRDLEVPGRDADGIHYAMDFLHQQSAKLAGYQRWNYPKDLHCGGKNVVVIGGGDTGADCIGTALRQGAKSVVNFELMPQANSERTEDDPWPEYNRSFKASSSYTENIALGGTTEFSIMTSRFTKDESGKVTQVITQKVAWANKEGGGREMTVVAGSEQAWPADMVLLAMGYLGPDGQNLAAELDLELDQKGHICSSENKGVFAAGDCRRGQSLVVWAIAEGREMAARVDEYLTKGRSRLSRCRLQPYAFH